MDDQRRDYAASLAGVIMERRTALGISSQAELARLVGVSEATAGRWERMTHLPDAWELRRLCEVLEVDPSELLHPEPLSPREALVILVAVIPLTETLGKYTPAGYIVARGAPGSARRPRSGTSH